MTGYELVCEAEIADLRRHLVAQYQREAWKRRWVAIVLVLGLGLFMVLVSLLWAPAVRAQEPAPAGYRSLWAAVQECSGVHDSTGLYDRLHWAGGVRHATSGEPLLAGYFPPDTIYLSDRAKGEAWVVAHEMLHALLGPTSLAHPTNPFLFPCKLMDFQQPGRVFMSARERA